MVLAGTMTEAAQKVVALAAEAARTAPAPAGARPAAGKEAGA